MISEENLVESLQENIMYPMVKQLHEYVKKHFVLFFVVSDGPITRALQA